MSIRTVPGRTRICTEELDGLMYSHEAILSELDNSVGLRQVDSAEGPWASEIEWHRVRIVRT